MKLGLLLALSLVGALSAADLEQARKLYHLTEYEQSLTVLQSLPQKDAAVYELAGRDYYQLGDFKKSTEALERAAAADPHNSQYALWLGRAYGRRAETSNPFSALSQASKARQYFERAVDLDPHSVEALNDLLEYYTDAPGMLGGGYEKAKATAARIAAVDPAEGHYALATLLEKHKELASAEEHLRRAIELAPHQVGRFVDLAKLLAKQGRYQESDQSFARAEQLAPDSPKLMYERADVYIKSGRNLEVAKDLLQRYLSATVTPDDPPKSDARKLLRQIKGG